MIYLLHRAIIEEVILGIFPKVNQIIYFSSPISMSHFRATTCIVFEITCLDDSTVTFTKGYNSRNNFQNFSKS